MVYESDFYTTRRPYSRPTVTSYSVTNSRLTPAVGKAHTYHPSIPFIAHKKLTNVTTPVPHNSVRKSVIGNTLDRIHYKPRSLQSYDPMEDFLNERSVTSFEDVTRSIRANTAALLKKVHTPVPRSVKPLSVSNLYNHTETAIADRISSDEYIWHLLRPLPGKPSNGIDVGYYPESSTRIPLGKTHLACLSYAGGHPIAKRRQLVAGAGDDFRNVRNDVELLSHYTRMRQAASLPHENGIVSNDASSNGASRFKHNAPTTSHTTEKVTTNGPLSSSLNEDDKENIASNVQTPLKKKPSRDISIDEDQALKNQEKALKEKQAEEERLEQERLAEEERIETERVAEEERKAEEERIAEEERLENERLEQERKAEEERVEQERLAEEERLEQERKAEEERLAQEAEEQRLLEEKLVEEYHREQERLAEEQRKREQEFAEEQQKLAQQKLAEEQKLLHEKLMEIKHQQEAEEENAEKDEEEEEEEEEVEKSEVAIEEVEDKGEENDSEYVTCNNIPKDSYESDKKNESAEEESAEEASDEEVAIAENVQQNGSVEVGEVVIIKKTITSSSTIEYEEFGSKTGVEKNEDEKSENTDANSDISEAEEEPNDSTVPELNHTETKDNDETQNESKENKEEEEETEEESEEEEEEEE